MTERWRMDGWLQEVGYGLTNRPWEWRFSQAMFALLETEIGMAEIISPEEAAFISKLPDEPDWPDQDEGLLS